MVVVVRPEYGLLNRFPGQLEKFFTLENHIIKSAKELPIPGNSNPFDLQRTIRKLVKCSELKTDMSGVNFSPKDLEDSYCIEFDTKTEMGGSYKDGLYRRFQLVVGHCVPSPSNDCVATPVSGPPVLTLNNLAL